jgi:prevent-host-death family protein
MRVINFSDARNKLKQVIDQVVDDADFTVIARRDSQDAVVMSLDTFNSRAPSLPMPTTHNCARSPEAKVGTPWR